MILGSDVPAAILGPAAISGRLGKHRASFFAGEIGSILRHKFFIFDGTAAQSKPSIISWIDFRGVDFYNDFQSQI